MNILIITGGNIDRAFASEFLQKACFDKVIAVDGGLAFADEICSGGSDMRLTDIVGDFDTISPAILKKYKMMPKGPQIHEYIPEKDNTDTDIALRLAIEMCNGKEAGSQICLLGATGSRLDHVLANITMLLLPQAAGIFAYIQDKNNRISLLQGTRQISHQTQFGRYISLIPLTPQISGLTLTGVKYPLENHSVAMGDSLCVSNELNAETATLTLSEGVAILLETRD